MLVLSLSLYFAGAEPVPEVACPKGRESVERAERYQAEADAELDAGHRVRAAELLGEVAAAYPECRSYHPRRMVAVQRALDARIAAYKADGQRSHLEAALASADDYLASLRAVYGDRADQTPGHRRLSELRAEIVALMPVEPPAPVVSTGPPASADKVNALKAPHRRVNTEPSSPPPRGSWLGLALGGGFAIGGGALAFGVGVAGASRGSAAGTAVTVASSLVIGGGLVMVGVAVHRRSLQMTLAPTIHPRLVGLGLQGRF